MVRQEPLTHPVVANRSRFMLDALLGKLSSITDLYYCDKKDVYLSPIFSQHHRINVGMHIATLNACKTCFAHPLSREQVKVRP